MAAARRNAFLRGFGGLFNWVDVLNRRLLAESPAEADAEALREDWERRRWLFVRCHGRAIRRCIQVGIYLATVR